MLNPGDRFGDYRVLRLLGKGGMGSVFLLENAEGVQIAAKILDPATASDREARKRFLREAQLALGVKHPNLVETYDVGEDPETGLCYILMEYVPGGSLADRVKAGPLAVNDAIRIVYQIASVLELARQRRIVHRDIKPGNILFGADGKPKLADLGIARGGIAGTETTTVTQTGMIIGTPAYMAPEQMLDAHNVDIRADIYSLGIVFYEMLVGKRPNADDSVVQLMAKAVAGEPIPDVRTMRPEVSAAVAELINLMCAMKADERVQTPAEVTTALSQIVHGREVTIRRKASKSVARKRWRMLLRKILPLALAAAGIAGFAVFAYFGRPVSAVRPPAEQPMADQVRSIGSNVPETKPMASRQVVTREQTAPVAERPAAEGRKPVEAARREEKPIVAERASGASGGRSRSGVTDPRIRYAKVGDRNWFYSLEDGEAVLWRGNWGYNNKTKPCVEPSPEGAIEIPSELDGHKVTVIGSLAFFRCRGITSVTIPEGVREIRGWAFLDCDSLVRVGIPATMESMKSRAFCSCRALRSIDIGKCPDVLGSTFWNCSSLEEVRVSPDNPSYVSRGGMLLARKSSTLVFHPRTREAVDWPRNLREIGDGAFLNSRVRELDVPDSVEKIGKNAFFNCHSLVRIGFGSGLKEVEAGAFMLCGRLRELDFPKSLVRLESSVADDCQALKRVVFRGDAPTVDLVHGSVLGKVSDKLEILVAAGTKGWNGPGTSDLPEKWPPGNFDDSRQIRYLGTQADDPARSDASSLVVEAPDRTRVKAKFTGASTPEGWLDDFKAACEQAKKAKKRILLVFSGSDWCGFCKRLDNDVLSEKKFIQQVSRKYVPVYVDRPRDRSLLSSEAQEQNPGLVDRYSPNGYPTVVVTDAEGEELARFSGYGGGGSSAFMRRLEDSIRDAERKRKRRK